MNGKQIGACAVLAVLALGVWAQNLPTHLRALSARGIEVPMDPTAVRAATGYMPPAKVAGYRLCLFSDNGQSARGAAAGALGALSSVAPDVRGEMIYTNPFFRVYAGHCLTKAEATMLLGRLKYSFPKAYIVGYSGAAADFAKVSAGSSVDSTAVAR